VLVFGWVIRVDVHALCLSGFGGVSILTPTAWLPKIAGWVAVPKIHVENSVMFGPIFR
jgi:hypothetical protein